MYVCIIYNYDIILCVDIFMCKVDTVLFWYTILYNSILSSILKTDVT